MDGKKLVEAAKWAKEHEGCNGCPLEEDAACIVLRDPRWNGQDVTVCEVADAILAAYEWGRREGEIEARRGMTAVLEGWGEEGG